MEKLRELPKQTAVRAIIVNSERKVMLIKRGKGTFEGGKWCLVGGKPDNDEELDVAVSRELQEEVGSNLPLSYWTEIENPDTSTGVKWTTHYFVGQSDELPTDFDRREVSKVGFFSQQELDDIEIAFDHRDILKRYFDSH